MNRKRKSRIVKITADLYAKITPKVLTFLDIASNQSKRNQSKTMEYFWDLMAR